MTVEVETLVGVELGAAGVGLREQAIRVIVIEMAIKTFLKTRGLALAT